MPSPTADLQPLSHSGIISLYSIDFNPIGIASICRFCNEAEADGTNVSFGGIAYQSIPIMATGFEINSTGQLPTPTLEISNIMGTISLLVETYDDLIGCKLIRRRTLQKYLDGQPGADSSIYFPDDEWYVQQKTKEDDLSVVFQLAASIDLEGLRLPKRKILRACVWDYRGDGCGYEGSPVATVFDVPTSDPLLDACGKRVSSCKLRFGQNGTLPFGGFPALNDGT